MSLFDDQPRAIEAATKVGPFASLSDREQNTPYRNNQAAQVLNAAVAALDREALIEKAVLAMRDPDGPPYGCGDARLIEYVFARIGLIPDSPEGTT